MYEEVAGWLALLESRFIVEGLMVLRVGTEADAFWWVRCNLFPSTFLTSYIRTNQSRLSTAYVFATTILNHHQIPYSPSVNAAFFLWIDL